MSLVKTLDPASRVFILSKLLESCFIRSIIFKKGHAVLLPAPAARGQWPVAPSALNASVGTTRLVASGAEHHSSVAGHSAGREVPCATSHRPPPLKPVMHNHPGPVFAAAALASLLCCCTALENGLARTPPMGWYGASSDPAPSVRLHPFHHPGSLSACLIPMRAAGCRCSWNAYHRNFNESVFYETADAMVANGMQAEMARLQAENAALKGRMGGMGGMGI